MFTGTISGQLSLAIGKNEYMVLFRAVHGYTCKYPNPALAVTFELCNRSQAIGVGCCSISRVTIWTASRIL